MNVLFISISMLPHMSEHSLSLDLIHEFVEHQHKVFVVCANERKNNMTTTVTEEAGCTVVRVKTGNNKKANLLEKGLTTIMLPTVYISAIKKYFHDVKFDLVLYPTPPITHGKTVRYVKKRDGAKSYLLLRDIFPQNAVDIGMMSKTGLKGIVYKYFRSVEKKLYSISDKIGCTSQANIDFIRNHNPEVDPDKMDICPNSIKVECKIASAEDCQIIRNKYNIPLDKRVFVYGGNLGRPQGIPFLIQCLKSQQNNMDAYFLIVGDGTEYKKLEEYIQLERPTNVRLMQRLPKEDYDRMVAACDVGMIFLDYRFTVPNIPSRLLSYMQAGLPVIACTDLGTDVGKIITEGGFGWWSPSNDVDTFRECVDNAMNFDTSANKEKILNDLEKLFSVEISYNAIMNFFNQG